MNLDTETPTDDSEISRLFLFGDGKNRWFDKSFSLIVTANAKAAINFEHSWGDGVAVVRFLDEIYRSSTNAPKVSPSSEYIKPEKLVFNVFFFFFNYH